MLTHLPLTLLLLLLFKHYPNKSDFIFSASLIFVTLCFFFEWLITAIFLLTRAPLFPHFIIIHHISTPFAIILFFFFFWLPSFISIFKICNTLSFWKQPKEKKKKLVRLTNNGAYISCYEREPDSEGICLNFQKKRKQERERNMLQFQKIPTFIHNLHKFASKFYSWHIVPKRSLKFCSSLLVLCVASLAMYFQFCKIHTHKCTY